MEAPFKVGNLVVLSKAFFSGKEAHLNTVVRKVLLVEADTSKSSGWAVSVNGPSNRKDREGFTDDSSCFKLAIAPFSIGDEVVFSHPRYSGALMYLNDVVREITSIEPSPSCVSGWQVSVNGPNMRNAVGGIGDFDSGWFKKLPVEDCEAKRLTRVMDKIIRGVDQGLSDQSIEITLQRHVSKAELIGLIRHLLKRG